MIEELTKELKEATARIIENRLFAWCSMPEDAEDVEIPLRPLTAQAWVDLKLIGNSIICGGDPSDDDMLVYLWRNSLHYSPKKSSKTEKIKKQIGFHYYSTGTNCIDLVFDHVDDAFEEMPISVNDKKSFSHKNSIPSIEGIIGAIDEVAARYGQNPSDVLSWPMNRIFQLQKAIRLATISDYKLSEPSKIKSIKSKILTELNNGTES
jgi:hypothetical protein